MLEHNDPVFGYNQHSTESRVVKDNFLRNFLIASHVAAFCAGGLFSAIVTAWVILG